MAGYIFSLGKNNAQEILKIVYIMVTIQQI